MVRLKDEGDVVIDPVAGRFQFQYGSIKSHIFLLIRLNTFVFQFQYGSIKSVFQKHS